MNAANAGAAELRTPRGAPIGFVRSVAPGDEAAAVRAARDLRAAGAGRVRIAFGLAAASDTAARDGLARVLHALGRAAEPLPSFALQTAEERLDDLLAVCAGAGDWMELRCPAWLDPARVQALVEGLQARGKRVVLAAEAAAWIGLLSRGVRLHADALGLLGAGTPDWPAAVAAVRAHSGAGPEIWICEAASGGTAPLADFLAATEAAADRLYWRLDGGEAGWRGPDGGLQLLPRLLRQGGPRAVAELARHAAMPREDGYALITGGAGFIGCNLAERLLARGERVLVYDTLTRPGTEQNLNWLMARHPGRIGFALADVRDRDALGRAVAGARSVFHFAAQVAVTTSLDAPVFDHEVNGSGTLFLLEALRACGGAAPLVFTSTNKVYGGLQGLALQAGGSRYEPCDPQVLRHGIGEDRPLEFRSPYGCSKGAADQYVLDYARTFGLPATVLRMSCIYGPHQFGTEDQGWVAHFLRRALAGEPITVYGDGLQVRDVLYASDLVEALLRARDHLPGIAGEAFNIGGGPQRVLSLNELLAIIARLQGRTPRVERCDWRPGDQRYYVSDTRKFSRLTGWSPQVGVEEGVARLFDWLATHRPAPDATAPHKEGELAV